MENDRLARLSSQSLLDYLRFVTIDGSRGPRRFGEVWEDWQQRSLVPIMAAIEGVVGINLDYPLDHPHCFWRDLPQGHDKTSGIARMLNGALAFNKTPGLAIGCFARDTDQANRIWTFMRNEARLNPWIDERLDFVQKKCRGANNSELIIYDADYEGNAGHKLHVCIYEELTWWMEKAKNLFDQLYTRRHKIQGAVHVVLGNAGIEGSWQWDAKEEFKSDPQWDYYRTEGSVATWIDPKQLERDKRSVTPSIAARIYDNRWIRETEQSYLRRVDLDACMARAALLGLKAEHSARPGIKYVCSIDYAASKDWCAMAVVAVFPDRATRVVKLTVLRPEDYVGGRVLLKDVEQWCITQQAAFANPVFVIDQYQCEGLIQAYEGRWQIHRFNYRGGLGNYAMAECLKDLIQNHSLVWPVDIGLVEIHSKTGDLVPFPFDKELSELITRDLPQSGYRWDHKANLHDDRAIAVGMACYYLHKIDPSGPFTDGTTIPDLSVPRPVLPGPGRQVQPEPGFCPARSDIPIFGRTRR